MSRLILVVVLLTLPACRGPETSEAPVAHPVRTAPAAEPVRNPEVADTLVIDTNRSGIAWKGTKMWGRGSHTGTVGIESGWLVRDGAQITGGEIVVDMTDIGITDIPADQPEPIRLLTSHLKDPLFFDVERYPRARIEITDGDRQVLRGNLTIKDVTRSIEVPYSVERTGAGSGSVRFRSHFLIDRFAWNIDYDGGFGVRRFAARNFVDDDIELTVTLTTRPGQIRTP